MSLDGEKSAKIEQWPESMKTRLDQTSLSDTEKKDYLTGFMNKFSSSTFLSTRRQMMEVESNWADSVHDVYSFALLHESQIVITKNRIGITSDVIRKQFNEKLTRSAGLRDDYVTAAKKVDELRTANMKREGVTPADLGLDK